MIYIGIIGFFFLALYDYTTLTKRPTRFITGIAGFSLISFSILYESITSFTLTSYYQLLGFPFALLFFALLIYSLFIELSFKTTYIKNPNTTYKEGTYALTRHPGVLWLFLMMMALSLSLYSSSLFYMALVFTFMNTLYVLWQENVIFIKQFTDYASYQQSTPFLIPSIKSFKKMIKTLNRRNTSCN